MLNKLPKEIAKELYIDLLKPSTSKVGQALGEVVEFSSHILIPIWMANKRVTLWKSRYEKIHKEMEKIPNENVARVPPDIGVPILEHLSYCSDEQISDYFINILIKASSNKTNYSAHPSFVQLLKGLSPDEALLIKYLDNRGWINFLHINSKLKSDAQGFTRQRNYLTTIEKDVDLLFKENVELYLDNFQSLGILREIKGYSNSPKSFDMIKDVHKKDIRTLGKCFSLEKYLPLEFIKGTFDITPYGRKLIDSCLSKYNDVGNT